MAYTPYPAEAADFSAKADALKEKLVEDGNELIDINSIFHVDTNEDYLTLKTVEANEKIIEIISNGLSTIDSDVLLVTSQANEFERQEKERQEALKLQQQDENSGNESS
jgi:hypothetical protein